MPSFRRCLALMLVIAFVTMVFAAAPATPKPWRFPREPPAVEPSFQDLLSSVSDDALHEVLHDVSDKYKHGAYPEDRAALEAIHQDSPAMAKGLVELARRQKSNATVTTVVTPTTSVVVVVPTTSVVVVTPARPTDPVGSTTQAANSPPPPQTSNPATPGSTGPQDTVTQTTIPVVTVTSAAVSTVTTDSPSPSGLTTITTTTKPVSTTKEVVFITTMPNGSPSTVTSFTIVAASEQSTPAAANPTVSVTPSLQNGATCGREPRGVGIAGAFIAAWVLVVGVL